MFFRMLGMISVKRPDGGEKFGDVINGGARIMKRWLWRVAHYKDKDDTGLRTHYERGPMLGIYPPSQGLPLKRCPNRSLRPSLREPDC